MTGRASVSLALQFSFSVFAPLPELFLFIESVKEQGIVMSMLKINGVERQYPDGLPASLAQLLEQLHINDATVVAEVDGTIIQRADFSSTVLKQGQAIELIRFVGGG